MEPLVVSLWELTIRVVFTVGRSVIYNRERNKNENGKRRDEKKENLRIVCDIFLMPFTPDIISVRCRELYERVVTRRACFGTEVMVASAGSRRWHVGTSSWKIVPTSSRRTERSSGKAPGIASWRVRTSARLAGLFTASWHGEASARRGAARRGAAAEPGRCQRGGSNDDLYPLLPVLLPTRDNTNHYHRLITGITANIEIMHACTCVYVPCARASDQHMCACTSQAGPAKGVAPSLISSLPPTLFLSYSFLSGRSAAAQYSTTLPASSAIRAAARRQPWPSQVRASAERSTACAAGDLPERSLDGGKIGEKRAGYGGAEGSLRREGIPRTREAGRPRCRRSKTPRACFARILLRSAVVLFSRNLPTWVLFKDDSSPLSYRE